MKLLSPRTWEYHGRVIVLSIVLVVVVMMVEANAETGIGDLSKDGGSSFKSHQVVTRSSLDKDNSQINGEKGQEIRKRNDIRVSNEEGHSKRSANPCARHSMVVNFTAVGYQHVLNPEKYEAYHCAGECTGSPMNLHTIFQSNIHNAQTQQNVNAPCCVPLTYTSLNVFLEGNTAPTLLNDMVVTTCGCR